MWLLGHLDIRVNMYLLEGPPQDPQLLSHISCLSSVLKAKSALCCSLSGNTSQGR